MPEALEAFFDRIEAPERSLVVVNRSGPQPIQTMLEDVFAGQPVDVRERDLPDSEEDLVVLVEQAGEDAEVVASSPLSAL